MIVHPKGVAKPVRIGYSANCCFGDSSDSNTPPPLPFQWHCLKHFSTEVNWDRSFCVPIWLCIPREPPNLLEFTLVQIVLLAIPQIPQPPPLPMTLLKTPFNWGELRPFLWCYWMIVHPKGAPEPVRIGLSANSSFGDSSDSSPPPLPMTLPKTPLKWGQLDRSFCVTTWLCKLKGAAKPVRVGFSANCSFGDF